jgi:PKD repeat protein
LSWDPDGKIVSWHWDFGDGSTSDERNPSHVYREAGSYTVKLEVRDDKGASATKTETVEIGPALGIVIHPSYLHTVVKGHELKFTVNICNLRKNEPIPRTTWPIPNYPEDALQILHAKNAPQIIRIEEYCEDCKGGGMSPPSKPQEAYPAIIEIITRLEQSYYLKDTWNPMEIYPGTCIPYVYELTPLKKGTWTISFSSRGEGTSTVKETIEVVVVEETDAIQDIALRPLFSIIDSDDSFNLSVSFKVDLSLISSLENLGLVPTDVSIRPPQVKVELFEEKGWLWVFDKKIAEKTLEIDLEKPISMVQTSFRLNGKDLGAGEHKLYAKVSVKYCIGERTCYYGLDNNWGTIKVESQRVIIRVNPGYPAIPGTQVKISARQSPGSINILNFSATPWEISLSEHMTVRVKFYASWQLNSVPSVTVKVVKRTLLGSFTSELAREQGSLGVNDIEIRLKGEEIVDRLLWWPIAGKYDLELVVEVSGFPPGTTAPVTITEKIPFTVSVRG